MDILIVQYSGKPFFFSFLNFIVATRVPTICRQYVRIFCNLIFKIFLNLNIYFLNIQYVKLSVYYPVQG